MRIPSLVQLSTGLLLLSSACTVNNISDSADSGVGGNANAASGGAAAASGGTNTAGTNAGSGGNSTAGTSPAIGGTNTAGTNSASGGTNAAGTNSASGGTNAAGTHAGSGGNSTAGMSPAIGGTNTAGTNLASGGTNTAGTNAGTGGKGIASGGTSFGGSASGGNASGGSSAAAGTSNVAGSGTIAKALPPSTFVFERKVGNGHDHLVAMDVVSRQQRVITTLAEGSVDGWNIDGATVSPDRTRVVIASLYGATAADNATGLATNRLWNLDTDGNDFRRLTPVFQNLHSGQTGWRIDVRDPAYSPDGQYILFDYGEGDSQSGYVAPWVVAADGSTLPSLIPTNLDCSVNGNAAFNPITGDLLLEHAVCIGGQKGGFFLYPNAGGAPDFLVNNDGISLSGEPPAFSADGSVFVYTGRTYSDNIQSLYAYSMSARAVVPLVLGSTGTDIVNASFSPDDRYMVYCVRSGNLYDLRAIDFSVDPPTDVELTTDGISCDAVF